MSLIKQTKLTKHMATLCPQASNKEPSFCVVSRLTEYLKRTKSYIDAEKLLLTYIKPFINESGISIRNYTSHSSRAAALSYAKSRGVSLSIIIQSADWKSERTFAQFKTNK